MEITFLFKMGLIVGVAGLVLVIIRLLFGLWRLDRRGPDPDGMTIMATVRTRLIISTRRLGTVALVLIAISFVGYEYQLLPSDDGEFDLSKITPNMMAKPLTLASVHEEVAITGGGRDNGRRDFRIMFNRPVKGISLVVYGWLADDGDGPAIDVVHSHYYPGKSFLIDGLYRINSEKWKRRLEPNHTYSYMFRACAADNGVCTTSGGEFTTPQ